MVGTYGSAAEFCDECEVAGLSSVMRYGLGQRTIPVLMPWEVPTPVHTVKEETP